MREAKRHLRGICAVVVVAAAIGAGMVVGPLRGVAHALGTADCAGRVADLADTDAVQMNRFEVDFGDGGEIDPYAGRQMARKTTDHTPAGFAVACWKTGRTAAYVMGTLYWDAYAAGRGGIIIQVFNTAGNELRRVAEVVDSTTGQFNSRTVNRALEFDAIHGGGTIDRVKLTAFRGLSDGSIQTIGTAVEVVYGD